MQKVKEFGCVNYPITIVADAKAVMDILVAAKMRCDDPSNIERYDTAIQSIGMHYLEMVEQYYKPEVKKYRVHIKGERWVEVEAHDEDEAEQMVNQGSDIMEFERTEEVEEVNDAD